MGITEILNEKKKVSDNLKTKYHLNRKNKVIGLVIFKDEKILEKLIEGISHLPIDVVIINQKEFGNKENIIYAKDVDEKNLLGFDFLICDDCESDLLKYLKNGIVPIVYKENYLNNVLHEFNAIKFEGNTFFYNDINEWSIFFALIRYLENYKFPYDNRNLVKNVLEVY